jgi:3,4-dihydroxyphenylacetate 2,3-dioxygenase
MGTLALAAKITHVPSMYLCEFPGPHFGKRDAAIAGHKEIDRRCRALGVDTIVVFDVHWQVNSEYHLNCAAQFEGTYTSNELPHFIKNLKYAYPGNPALGHAIADMANSMGIKSRAHSDTSLELEYGTLVPMRYMNSDQHYQVICVSAWCDWHDLRESQRFGHAVRRAIEENYQGTVAVFASGSLSHHFADNGKAPEYAFKVYNAFLEQVDLRVVELWERGQHQTVVDMLPMYNDKCWGEGDMHDTAMLYGAVGGPYEAFDYREKVEVITPYFGSSGTGQINAIFPVTPWAAKA